MRATLKRIGNSIVLPLPKNVVARLRLKDGQRCKLVIASDELTVRFHHRRKWTAAELLKGVSPRMVKGEIDWGRPVGKELI